VSGGGTRELGEASEGRWCARERWRRHDGYGFVGLWCGREALIAEQEEEQEKKMKEKRKK
jgi:hypothetical protein